MKAIKYLATVAVALTLPCAASAQFLGKEDNAVTANKMDDARAEAEAYGLWNLGLGEPYPVSALHGRGSGDMLDAVLAALPDAPEERFDQERGPRRIAKPQQRAGVAEHRPRPGSFGRRFGDAVEQHAGA